MDFIAKVRQASNKEPDFNAFAEAVLISTCFLKPVKNSQGEIKNFIITAINALAEEYLPGNKNQLIGSKLFKNFVLDKEKEFFDNLCLVFNKHIVFYRKSYTGFPFKDHDLNFRIKAVKFGDKIFLNWVDSSLPDKLFNFAKDNRKLRESEKKQTEELHELEQIKEFYRILGNTIPYGGWMADGSGNILHISPSFSDLVGATKEEILEEGWIKFLPESETKRIKSLWETSLLNKEVFNAEYEILDVDKNIHSILSTAYPLINSEGDVQYWVGIHLNNDEQKEIENKLNILIDKLRKSNEELQQFAYIASHDLQEPLRMVASFTQLLERRYKDKLDKEGLEFINFAVDGAKRMKDLIDGLLLYSRVSTRAQLAVTVDLNELMITIIENFKILLEETNAEIIHNSNLPVIHADKNQIYQLFQNLILNGIKYRREEKSIIKISAVHKNSFWQFSVSDNGIGIDKKYFKRIFIIFQRLHSRDQYSGTGIGLAVCKRIVESMGGKIWVDSEINKGSTFHFTIPERNIINVK